MPQEPDVETLAEDIFRKVGARAKDPLIKWNTDGSFRVVIGRLLPDGSAAEAVLFERRKRFREALTKRLGALGYTEQGYGRYSPEGAGDDETDDGQDEGLG